jgi:putative drug exporter of the RND superfamily
MGIDRLVAGSAAEAGGSAWLRRLATVVVARPRVVLGATFAFLVVAGALGAGVSKELKVGGFEDSGSAPSKAQTLLDDKFGGSTNLVLQVTARNGDVGTARRAAEALTNRVTSRPGFRLIDSYWSTGSRELRSRDMQSGLIELHVAGSTEERADRVKEAVDALPEDDPAIRVGVAGSLGVTNEINADVDSNLVKSESIALPTTLLLLIVVFGGVVAALVPIALGVTSIVATWLMLLVLSKLTDVSVYALIVATAFGLGLAIDFGLLMVSRVREERSAGKESGQAVVEAVATAGETILFSATTVGIALASTLVFPIYFLRSVGLAAMAVVAAAAIGAVVVLPALLAFAGDRIDSWRLVRRRAEVSSESHFWRGLAAAVMRRPALAALPVIGVMIVLAVPLLHARFAPSDERALSSGSSVRQVVDDLRRNYPTDSTAAVIVVDTARRADLQQLAGELSALPEVKAVDGAFGRFAKGSKVAEAGKRNSAFVADGAAYLQVLPSVAAESEAAQSLVRAIRRTPDVARNDLLVGGPTATLLDFRSGISHRLGLALALVASTMFVLLFLFTRSVVVPVKAMLLNLLTLGAVLGAMVWLFQDGHLVGGIGVTPAPLNLAMVVLLCTIVFGLSVDYEIFLLSRIKEARARGADTVDATVEGLGRVGRIVTAAAALLTVTLFSFSIGPSFMKMFGIGTGLAILLDATLVRGVLVPAFMRVAGDFNWWAPRPLLRALAAIERSAAPATVADEPQGPPPARRELGVWSLPPVPAPDGAAGFLAINPGTEQEALVPIHGWLFVGRACDGLDEHHRLLVGDADISREHLKIGVSVEPRRAFAVDISRNGTTLNGRVMQPRNPEPLAPGDTLGLAPSLVVQFRSAQDPQ